MVFLYFSQHQPAVASWPESLSYQQVKSRVSQARQIQEGTVADLGGAITSKAHHGYSSEYFALGQYVQGDSPFRLDTLDDGIVGEQETVFTMVCLPQMP